MKNCDEDDVCALTERDCEWSCLSRYYGRFDYTFDYPIQPSVTLWLRVGIRVRPCYGVWRVSASVSNVAGMHAMGVP